MLLEKECEMGIVYVVVGVFVLVSVLVGMKVVVEGMSEAVIGGFDWLEELDVKLFVKGGDDGNVIVRLRELCDGGIVDVSVRRGWKWDSLGYVVKKDSECVEEVLKRMNEVEMEECDREDVDVYREEKCERCGCKEWKAEVMGDLMCEKCIGEDMDGGVE